MKTAWSSFSLFITIHSRHRQATYHDSSRTLHCNCNVRLNSTPRSSLSHTCSPPTLWSRDPFDVLIRLTVVIANALYRATFQSKPLSFSHFVINTRHRRHNDNSRTLQCYRNVRLIILPTSLLIYHFSSINSTYASILFNFSSDDVKLQSPFFLNIFKKHSFQQTRSIALPAPSQNDAKISVWKKKVFGHSLKSILTIEIYFSSVRRLQCDIFCKHNEAIIMQQYAYFIYTEWVEKVVPWGSD